ncbi:hypothetical protein M6B38_140740 [Iris pallida]|uniref:Uncharacterized protein n=1 Tax=Iris pallida TaxID=29817 RepID=A0AAX6FEL6_IRIPA|nr:hypothetical protein M6B38_140740 [Iris pallida]
MAPMTRTRRLKEAQMAAEEVVVPPTVDEEVLPPAAEEVIPKAEIKVEKEVLPPTIKKKMIPKADIAVKEEVAPEGCCTGSFSHPAPIVIWVEHQRHCYLGFLARPQPGIFFMFTISFYYDK